jgi:hypothetical protein
VARGKLPWLSRLREEGAHGRLRTYEPCLAPVSRTTLMSGKLPYRHGVRGALERRLPGSGVPITVVPPGLGFDLLIAPLQASRPLTMADSRVLLLWEMVGLLGGATVSGGWEMDLDATGTAGAVAGEGNLARSRVEELLGLSPGAAAGLPDRLLDDLGEALREDERVAALLTAAPGEDWPELTALSFPGLDRIAHACLRYARPGEFGNVSRGEIERLGPVLEGYYRYVDSIIGRAAEGGGEGTTIFVTSSHGMAPVTVPERLLSALGGGGRRSGSHERAPGGMFFARGPDIRGGLAFGRASIVDVVPTALYALGRPVARDLDGRIRTGIFTTGETRRRAVTLIDSYEALR